MTKRTQDRTSFVPAVDPRDRQWAAPQVVDVVPIPATDISPVLEPTTSRSRDAISAQDRAKGFNLRLAIPMGLTLILAVVVVLAYTWILSLMDVGQVAPYMLDRVLIFLGVVFAFGMLTWTKANQVDHDHTQAGVERLRITTAAEIRKVELQAELQQRQMATEAMLTMLERREQIEVIDHE